MPTQNFSSTVMKVRALIPDIEKLSNPNRPEQAPEYMLSDEHVQSLLDSSGGSVTRAVAYACDLIGMSEAIISKVITMEDLATDGAKLMNAMQARATRYFAMADREDADSADSFHIVPFGLDHYEAH